MRAPAVNQRPMIGVRDAGCDAGTGELHERSAREGSARIDGLEQSKQLVDGLPIVRLIKKSVELGWGRAAKREIIRRPSASSSAMSLRTLAEALPGARLDPEHLTAQLAVGAQGGRRALVGDAAAVQHADPIGQRQDEVEVVLDDQDGHLPAQAVEGAEDRLAHRGGQALEGLIQEQDLEVARQGARDGYHLLLATREGLRAAPQPLPDAGEKLEDALGLPADALAALPPEPAELEVLGHREGRDEPAPLGHEAHAQARDRLGGVAGNLAPRKLDV